MKKFILGIFIGVIIALAMFLLLKTGEGEAPTTTTADNVLNKIKKQQNYQNDVQEKLRDAVSNLLQAKEPNDIIKSLDEILKYRPHDANIHTLKAQILQQQGNLPGALEEINKAIAIDPKNPNYYQMRGEIEFNSGNYNKAEQDFTIAAQLSGKADNYYNRAITNLNLGNYQAANRDLKKAQELYKKEGNNVASKQAKNISKILTKNMPKQLSEIKQNSTKTAKRAVATNNPIMSQKVLNQISNSLKHFSEKDSLKNFKEFMPKADDITSAFSGLPTQMPKTETPTPAKEDSIPTFEDTIKEQKIQTPKINKKEIIKDTPLESMLKVRKMLANKDFEGAKSELDSAIEKFPDNDSLYHHRAQVNYQNGDYKSAFSDLNKALEINPNNYQAIASKGDFYNSLGQSEQAKKSYLEAGKLAQKAGDTNAMENAKTKYQLLEGKEITAKTNQRFAEASNAYTNGDFSKAVNLFNQIYEENPDGPNAFNLGLAYMGTGDMQKANEMFVISADKQPNDLKAQMAVANGFIQNNDFDTAKKYLDKAMQIDDTNPDAWVLSAQINSDKGDYETAKKDLEKSLQGYEQKLGEIENPDEREKIEEQMRKIKNYLDQLSQTGI